MQGFVPHCPVQTVVNDLDPFTTYDATVRVWTSAGEGQQNSIDFTTDEDVPSGPPTKIALRRAFSHNLIIEWESPVKPNGIIHYSARVLIPGIPRCSNIMNKTTVKAELLYAFYPSHRKFIPQEWNGMRHVM